MSNYDIIKDISNVEDNTYQFAVYVKMSDVVTTGYGVELCNIDADKYANEPNRYVDPELGKLNRYLISHDSIGGENSFNAKAIKFLEDVVDEFNKEYGGISVEIASDIFYESSGKESDPYAICDFVYGDSVTFDANQQVNNFIEVSKVVSSRNTYTIKNIPLARGLVEYYENTVDANVDIHFAVSSVNTKDFIVWADKQ